MDKVIDFINYLIGLLALVLIGMGICAVVQLLIWICSISILAHDLVFVLAVMIVLVYVNGILMAIRRKK